MKPNSRQLSTILAALRYWQREGIMSGGHEHDIASDGDTLEPLTADEIDDLCEELNCDPETNSPHPSLKHLDEELTAIIKALDEGNPSRAHWLARKAKEHIAEQTTCNSDTPSHNIELFRRRYELQLASLRSMITENVRSTGNIEADCQQLTILNRLSALEHALNGTQETDLIGEEPA